VSSTAPEKKEELKMASRLKRDDKSNATWSPAQTYMTASICLLLGIAIG
jgi:hypothetical protein